MTNTLTPSREDETVDVAPWWYILQRGDLQHHLITPWLPLTTLPKHNVIHFWEVCKISPLIHVHFQVSISIYPRLIKNNASPDILYICYSSINKSIKQPWFFLTFVDYIFSLIALTGGNRGLQDRAVSILTAPVSGSRNKSSPCYIFKTQKIGFSP